MKYEDKSEASNESQVDKTSDAKSQEGNAAIAQQAWGPQAGKDQPKQAGTPTDAQQQQQINDGLNFGNIYGGFVQGMEDGAKALANGVEAVGSAVGQDAQGVLKGVVQANETVASAVGQDAQAVTKSVADTTNQALSAVGRGVESLKGPVDEISRYHPQAVTDSVGRTVLAFCFLCLL